MKTVCIAFLLSIGLFVRAQNYQPIYIYPNPATELMTVELPYSFLGITNIYITDIQGQVLYQTERNLYDRDFRKMEIYVNNLLPGFYILNVRNSNNWMAQKFKKN